MNIEEFILTENKSLLHLTPKIKEEEEKKMIFWRIHDSAYCDVELDEDSIQNWIEKTSSLPIPKVNEVLCFFYVTILSSFQIFLFQPCLP